MTFGANRYGAVYVVSDLHLGGFETTVKLDDGSEVVRDLRTFFEAKALAWLLSEVESRARVESSQRVALVLNGDIVDFLALEHPSTFSATQALFSLLRRSFSSSNLVIFWPSTRTSFSITPFTSILLGIPGILISGIYLPRG